MVKREGVRGEGSISLINKNRKLQNDLHYLFGVNCLPSRDMLSWETEAMPTLNNNFDTMSNIMWT